MNVLAIDPGPVKSGWVVYGNGRVEESGVSLNSELLTWIGDHASNFADEMAIEMVASYGMPVGREVFETVWWTGRFTQAWPKPNDVRLIYRRDVKLELCGTAKAKDANVRQALLDRVGPRGTKRAPGPTYGVSGDMWAALGVAVIASGAQPAAPRTDLFEAARSHRQPAKQQLCLTETRDGGESAWQ